MHRLKSIYVQVLIAIALGVLVGAVWPTVGVALKPLGDGFIKLVKLVIAPVIFCTVAGGIARMSGLKTLGRVGGKAILYFEVVSTFALLLGVAAAFVGREGRGRDQRLIHVRELGADLGRGGDILRDQVVELVVDVLAGVDQGAGGADRAIENHLHGLAGTLQEVTADLGDLCAGRDLGLRLLPLVEQVDRGVLSEDVDRGEGRAGDLRGVNVAVAEPEPLRERRAHRVFSRR